MNSPTSEAVNEQLNVLLDVQCCVVLYYFARHSTEVATIDDLGEFIRDQNQQEGDVTHIETRLHHVTLPKLADVGVLEYDARSNTARYRGHPTVEKWVTHLDEQGCLQMASNDADEGGGAETDDQTTMMPTEQMDSETRERTMEHLQRALSTTESDEKQFHIREALQLLRINER
ncbi:hypothetical protein BRC82_02225 [Halobacteriales archaeon QS_1_67_19]|nr:MAG: hypothetical protein BRC82_02225 [Halobacteriales archaeon QS_1_67_19]